MASYEYEVTNLASLYLAVDENCFVKLVFCFFSVYAHEWEYSLSN